MNPAPVVVTFGKAGMIGTARGGPPIITLKIAPLDSMGDLRGKRIRIEVLDDE